MSTHNIRLYYRTPKRYPTIISIMYSGMALIITLRGSNYRCLEQIFMVPKEFEPLKFDCTRLSIQKCQVERRHNSDKSIPKITKIQSGHLHTASKLLASGSLDILLT